MKAYVPGILLGVGIGWFVTSKRGKEVRRLVGVRLQELRGSLSEHELLNQYVDQVQQVQQVSNSFSQVRSNLGNMAQLTIGKMMKEYGSTFTELARLVVNKVMENESTFRDLGNLTKVVSSVVKPTS